MNPNQLCPDCGATLPVDAVEGLCPQCLLRSTVLSQSHSADPTARHLMFPEPLPGCSFGGYRIVRLLGRGGMGSVFEAEQIENGRRVALKVLRHAPDSPSARQRFLREGRLAASINHPNSVYIFGTEEIGDTPVITMEYVSGGTLTERVKRQGPMPIGEAVDSILQIVDGLEAAANKGVLHRDIKPSNCFVEADGTVKVGDFGLSVSTLARDQTNVTLAGVMMGTPAYASPEQLRGDELDVRSDIYSVGVTLYYLLTGETPFCSENMVNLVATVLEKPAPSPRALRPEIPEELGVIVLRCLAKQPAQRFKDYEALRQALLPFGSTAPASARLGIRFLAGVIDVSLMVLLTLVLTQVFVQLPGQSVTLPGELPAPDALWLVTTAPFVLRLLYFAVFEGFWGITLGKYVCRLKVIGPNRNRPGFLRAFARALIIVVARYLPPWVWGLGTGSAVLSKQEQSVGLFLSYALLTLLFINARRRNGYAALHDLVTGTRVVQRAAYERRSTLTPEDVSIPKTQEAPNVGPFHVLDLLARHGGEEILLGYDTRLLRKVWIRKQPLGSAPLPAAVRDLTRTGRLHWLAGRRTATECWDAYEAIAGQPLVNLLNVPQPWASVRFWLHDLAEELDAARHDGSWLNPPGLERVWISADGRAKLLDFPAPGIAASVASPGETATQSDPSHSSDGGVGRGEVAKRFLCLIAGTALVGGGLPEHESSKVPQIPLPMSAREFLQTLHSAQDLQAVLAQLRPLLDTPAVVSGAQRRALMYISITIAFLFGGLITMLSGFMLARDRIPDPSPLSQLLPMMVLSAFAVPSLMAALLLRRGLGYRLLRIEIVTSRGVPARRWRTFLRCLLAWLPFLLLLLLAHLADSIWPVWMFVWMFVLCVVGGIVYRVIHPGRPIRDRLAGTWLVPG